MKLNRSIACTLKKGRGGFLLLLVFAAGYTGQAQVDTAYIGEYAYPYVVRLSLERTGAGLQISPDHTVIPATASFPFNTGTNLSMNLHYKLINFSISQSLNQTTNNKSFVIALDNTTGPVTIGGKLGFYNNVAALDEEKTINTATSINLFKFKPFFLYNFNHRRFALAAVTDYSLRQRKSAGAFMLEVSPFIMQARGKQGEIIPSLPEYESRFGDMAGLTRLVLYNLDIRPGYMYTLSFEEGTYFISGGVFAGTGFGYHHARKGTSKENGLHWQTTARILLSGGYNQEKYFITASLRYHNSFTPVSNIGVLANEALYQLTFGLRFNAFEKKLPNSWNEVF